jgi:hypothetical protein
MSAGGAEWHLPQSPDDKTVFPCVSAPELVAEPRTRGSAGMTTKAIAIQYFFIFHQIKKFILLLSP